MHCITAAFVCHSLAHLGGDLITGIVGARGGRGIQGVTVEGRACKLRLSGRYTWRLLDGDSRSTAHHCCRFAKIGALPPW